jgi:hypothetical protein
VARAKRTARAEARRRSRAAQNLQPEVPLEGDDSTAAPQRATGSSEPKPAAPGQRLPFTVAIRAAVRPVHVREDIRSLPWIAVHSKALWLPLLITVGSFAAVALTHGGDLSLLLFAYFIQTPAIGGVFIAGFLAPRASWLLGVIVGLVAALCYSIIVLALPSAIYAGVPPTQDQAIQVALSAFLLSPPFGALLASGAAWYRRFLRLSAPARVQKNNDKKARAGDGRTRATPVPQKAGAKR